MLAAVLAAVLLFTAAGAHAMSFRAECEARLERTNVSVKPETAAYVTNSTLGINELTARNLRGASDERILGLTIAHLTTSVDFVQNGLQAAHSTDYCMRPRFTVKLSYSPIEIYVGHELKRGSCPYMEVVHHEEKHVAAYELQLRNAAETVERAMRAYYADTIFYGDSAKLLAQLTESIQHHWLPLAEQQLAAVEAAQHAIDTPQEYAHYRTACNGEINRILQGLH